MRRRTALRMCGWVGAVLLAFAGVTAAYPEGVCGLAGDVWCHERNVEWLNDQEDAGEHLDAAISTRADRVRSLNELSEGLAGGTVRLRDAAHFYLAVLSAEPQFFEQYRNSLPGSSDLERVAVALLRAAFSSPGSTPSRQSLLTQFRAEFGSEYPLPLPPPDESQFTAGRNTHP